MAKLIDGFHPWHWNPVMQDDLKLSRFMTYRLSQLTNRLNRQTQRLFSQRWRLRIPEWRCLAILCEEGPAGVNQIALSTAMDKGLISRTIAALEAKKLVKVSRGKSDKRQITAVPTDKGRAMVDQILPIMRHRQKHLLDALDRKERRMIYQIIDKLVAASDTWENLEAL